MFGSTLRQGLNTNVVDRRIIAGGRNTRQYHALWVDLHLVTKTERIPAFNLKSDRYDAWFKRHVASKFPAETPEGWYSVVRRIASEIKAGPIRSFDPLPDRVWEGRVPGVRVKGRPLFDMIADESRLETRGRFGLFHSPGAIANMLSHKQCPESRIPLVVSLYHPRHKPESHRSRSGADQRT